MKILFFVPQGAVEPKHLDYKFEQNKISNKVIFGNGSFNHGFEDSCDKVVLDCENKNIELWANKLGIPIENFGVDNKEVKIEVKGGHTFEAKDVTKSFEDEDIDSLVASQVAKAEVESTLPVAEDGAKDSVAEQATNEVPLFKDIPAGKYKDPEGNVFERKPQGSKLKGDFTKAIEKFGFDKFEKVE